VRVTRVVGVIGISCVLGLGCAGGDTYAPESYVVQPRDTLYSIAWRHDLDYRDLARWNHLGSDYRIAVGQILLLKPVGSNRSASAAVSRPQNLPRSSPPKPVPPTASVPAVPAVPAVPTAPTAVPGASIQWLWPTDHSSAPRQVPGGGILMLGQLGQDIHAASTGRVVYIGNGLRGYGNLIIIKHGDNVLSAYAHNSELLVHEGQDVQGGQVIAHMGTGPHQVAALYFEIRLNGKPVDPLPYLMGMK
jgi:lipoprotein NlpD